MDTYWKSIRTRFDSKTGDSRGEYGCMLWVGAKDRDGYGRFIFRYPDKRRTEERAHRIALCISNQILPNCLIPREGSGGNKEVSHLCHNPACVLIDHLVIETHIQNMDRLHCRQQGFCSKCHKPHCLM